MLTGKHPDAPPAPGTRAASGDKRIAETEFHPANLEAAARFAEHCRGRGTDLAAFAGAWVLANPIVTSLIAGPRTLEQWRSYLAILTVAVDAEDEAAVARVTPAGTTAIPQFIDPAYPVEGRPIDL